VPLRRAEQIVCRDCPRFDPHVTYGGSWRQQSFNLCRLSVELSIDDEQHDDEQDGEDWNQEQTQRLYALKLQGTIKSARSKFRPGARIISASSNAGVESA